MTRRACAALLTSPVVCLVLASCVAGVGGAAGTLRTDEIRLPPERTGTCTFDYGAAVSKVASDGTVVWSTNVPWADGMPQPVVMDGAVVQATSDGPVGVDAETGAALWQWDGGLDGVWAGAGPSGVVHADEGGVESLDPRTGAVSWLWSASGRLGRTAWSGPPAGSAVPFVAVRDGRTITALDASSGDTLWEAPAARAGDQVLDVTADGTTVVEVAEEKGVVARRADTGAVRWRWTPPRDSSVSGPAQSNHHVVVVQQESQAVALDADDGSQLWRAPHDGGSGARLVTDAVVLLADPDRLRALDPVSGELLWQHDGLVGDVVPHLVVADGLVLVVPPARSSAILALDLDTGEQVWRDSLEGVGFSVPTVVDGRVLVGSELSSGAADVDAPDIGRMHAIDLATGDVLWSTTFRDAVQLAPVPVDDGFVVTSSDGAIGCE